jgi:hypothetical protein
LESFQKYFLPKFNFRRSEDISSSEEQLIIIIGRVAREESIIVNKTLIVLTIAMKHWLQSDQTLLVRDANLFSNIEQS